MIRVAKERREDLFNTFGRNIGPSHKVQGCSSCQTQQISQKMDSKVVRAASHAGSWYTDKGNQLSKQLETWLNQVPGSLNDIGPLPQPGATMIIAP